MEENWRRRGAGERGAGYYYFILWQERFEETPRLPVWSLTFYGCGPADDLIKRDPLDEFSVRWRSSCEKAGIISCILAKLAEILLDMNCYCAP